MAKELDKRRQDFCKYKAQGYSNVESAVKAGYTDKTAKTKAHLWLDKSEIKEEIERLKGITREVADKKFGYTAEESFRKLKEIQDLALCPDGENGRLNHQAALKAEELKGKLTGLYVDRVEDITERKLPFEVRIVK